LPHNCNSALGLYEYCAHAADFARDALEHGPAGGEPMRRRRACAAAALTSTKGGAMRRLHLVRLVPPARPAVTPAKVISLASRRQARLERLDRNPRPTDAA
jgi:hypothetical protein